MPDIGNLKAIADAFDVTLDSLICDEEEIETSEEGFSRIALLIVSSMLTLMYET